MSKRALKVAPPDEDKTRKRRNRINFNELAYQRIEDLLVEMRCEQDVQLKRVAALHAQIDNLTEQVSANRMGIRRLARNRRK